MIMVKMGIIVLVRKFMGVGVRVMRIIKIFKLQVLAHKFFRVMVARMVVERQRIVVIVRMGVMEMLGVIEVMRKVLSEVLGMHHHIHTLLCITVRANVIRNAAVIGTESFVTTITPYQPVVLDCTILTRFGSTNTTNHHCLATYTSFLITQIALIQKSGIYTLCAKSTRPDRNGGTVQLTIKGS